MSTANVVDSGFLSKLAWFFYLLQQVRRRQLIRMCDQVSLVFSFSIFCHRPLHLLHLSWTLCFVLLVYLPYLYYLGSSNFFNHIKLLIANHVQAVGFPLCVVHPLFWSLPINMCLVKAKRKWDDFSISFGFSRLWLTPLTTSKPQELGRTILF